MGVQAVAGPAFELGGIVAAEEMARARRYEGAALQHIAAKIGDAIGDRTPNSKIEERVGHNGSSGTSREGLAEKCQALSQNVYFDAAPICKTVQNLFRI